MATKLLINSRETIAAFKSVYEAQSAVSEYLAKDGKKEGDEVTADLTSFDQVNFMDTMIQGSTVRELLGDKVKDLSEVTDVKSLKENLDKIIAANPAPKFMAPLTNAAVYKALTVAGFVTLAVMSSGMAPLFASISAAAGVIGATYFGFQLATSHVEAFNSLWEKFNTANNDAPESDKKRFHW